jgi:hypothetical protein
MSLIPPRFVFSVSPEQYSDRRRACPDELPATYEDFLAVVAAVME